MVEVDDADDVDDARGTIRVLMEIQIRPAASMVPPLNTKRQSLIFEAVPPLLRTVPRLRNEPGVPAFNS